MLTVEKTTPAITVKEVTTKKELRRFVDYPNRLYRDNPYFVPAFYGDDLADWDKKKNPAFEYCEAKCFLAYQEGKIVGRIGAILSHRANEKWGTQRMRFTQVDFIDDRAVSAALFGAVEDWAREKGCTQVHGPLGFCDMDREGMLVEGFEEPGLFFTYYNPPYYNDHLAALGYEKDTDWMEYRIKAPAEGDPQVERFHRLAERVNSRYHFHFAKLKHRRDYVPYIRQVFQLVNECYAPLYGVVELSERQIEKYAHKFAPLVQPDFAALLLDDQDNMVAFGVSAPSVEKAIKKSHGRLFPFGFLGVLKSFYINDTVDMLLIAVRPDLQSTGVNAVLLDHLIQSGIKHNIRYAETGPMLETNSKVLSQWKHFEKRQHKRRRCYLKNLE